MTNLFSVDLTKIVMIKILKIMVGHRGQKKSTYCNHRFLEALFSGLVKDGQLHLNQDIKFGSLSQNYYSTTM